MIAPRVGKATDHEVVGVVVWLFRRGEEGRCVVEVSELDGFGDQKVWFVDGV